MSRSAAALVLVTGAAGRLGTTVAARLARHYRVVGLDLQVCPEPLSRRGVGWQPCDLTDDSSTADALSHIADEHGRTLASVVHLAAHPDDSGEPSARYEDLNVAGTRRLLRGLRAFEVEQLVYRSSTLVMKPASEGEQLSESDPADPAWAFPRSMLETERVLAAERRGTPVVVLRVASAYDEDCRCPPLADPLRRIYEKKLGSPLFPGSPARGQAFVHVDDVARCVEAAVGRRGGLDDAELFLVGEPEALPYGELHDRMGEALHGRRWDGLRRAAQRAAAAPWLTTPRDPGDDAFVGPWMIDRADAHRPLSVERARARLGFEPRRRLRDAIPEMAARLVRDPVRWYELNGFERPEAAPRARPGPTASRGAQAADPPRLSADPSAGPVEARPADTPGPA
jgi:nucleoside-diphosphate-sugar epimerase